MTRPNYITPPYQAKLISYFKKGTLTKLVQMLKDWVSTLLMSVITFLDNRVKRRALLKKVKFSKLMLPCNPRWVRKLWKSFKPFRYIITLNFANIIWMAKIALRVRAVILPMVSPIRDTTMILYHLNWWWKWWISHRAITKLSQRALMPPIGPRRQPS